MFYFGILSMIFSPVLMLPPILAEIVIGAFIVFIITLFNKFFVDQKQMKELKEKQKEIQAEVKEMQKTNPEAANKRMKEVMGISNKIMKLNFKAMLPTMLLVITFLPWIKYIFPGIIAKIPATIPFLTLKFPFIKMTNSFGWLSWYFLVSLSFTQLFRKILGVQ